MPAIPPRRNPVASSILVLALLMTAALAVPAAAQEAPPLLRPQPAAAGGVELVPASGLDGDGGLEAIFGFSGDLSPFGTFDLPAGSSVVIEFDVTVDDPLAAGVFTVGNQSTITADQVGAPGVLTDDPDVGGASDATITNLLVSADLTATKVDVPASGTAVPGNPITYSVVYGNDGPAGVVNAPVTDTFPAALQSCSWSCGASANGNCDAPAGPNAGDVSTTVDLEVGATVTFSITCDVDPAATGSLVNTASIGVPAMVTEVDATDDSATDTNTLTPQGDLSIAKTTPSAPVVPGTTETYQVVVANSGPSTATGVDVSDVFPAGSFSNVSWTCTASAGSTCTAGPANGDLSDTITLAPSGTATYTITADVDGGLTGTLSNTASLTIPAGFTDTNPGNESDTVTDSLDPSGDLSVTKTTITSPVVPGGTVQYQVVVANSGPSDAVDALVTDTFAGILSGVSWTCTASAGSSCAAAGNGDLSELVTVAGGGTVTFSVTATVDAAASGNLANTASVTPPAGFDDATNGNDSDTVSDALVASGDVAVTKTTLTSPVVAGQPVQYQVVVTNGGPSTLTGATVQDNFPGVLANESWTCVATAGSSCAANGNGDVLDAVTLLGGGSATYSVTADLAASATGTLDNTASVLLPAGFTDGTPGNNSDSTSDAVQVVTGLSITKTDGVAAVPPAATLTYTIVVSNAGPSTAVGATVSDVFPAELTGVSWTCVGAGGGTCTAGPVNGDVNDNVDLPPGGSVTYTASGTGNTIGTVSNTATVAVGAGATDPNPADNSATDETFVGSPADVTGTKSVAGDTTIGGTVLYTVTLINGGTGEQLNNPGDEFVDVLPPELTLVGASVISGGGGVAVDLPGNTVTWNGAIPIGGTVVIEIEATVNDNAAGVQVSNQGEINYDMDGDGTNEANRGTDDPQQPGAQDPTVFQAGTVLDIPTLSPVGIALLFLLLAGLGLWRMRRRGALAAGLALVLLVGLAGAAEAQTTVDDFSLAQGPNEDPGISASTADDAGILGGERDLVVTKSSGPGTVSGEAAGGTFTFTAPVDTRGQVELTWDGNDGNATTLDPTGLGGVDLTATGQSGFRFTVDASAAGVALVVEVFTDAGNSSRAGRLLDTIAAATDVYVPFGDFVVAAGGGADFTNVGAVRVRLSGTDVSATLDAITTAAPMLAAVKVDLDTSDVPLGGTQVPPGGTIRYRVQVSNSGSDATTVDVNDLVDANTTVVPGTIRSTPVPVGDSYQGLGNVTLTVPGAEGLLANDTDPDGDTLTIDVSPFPLATAQGGTVQNVDANTGAFEYLPPAGYRGVDTFQYTVQDDDANTAVATVHVLLEGVVWFVDSDNEACGAGDCGTGTSADPFETLDQAEVASMPGDWIRLRDGADDLTDHDTGIVLKDGQNLIGEGVALVIDGQTIEPAGLVPELTHAGAGGHGIVLTGNHEVRGLEVDGAGGTAITGANLGTVVLENVIIEDTDPADGGAALDLDTVASLTATFTSIQSNGSATGGIRLNNVVGTLTVNGATTLTDPVDHGLRIEGSPGLTATFNGGVTVVDAGEGGPDAAIHLANNGAAVFNFGALDLDTENGDGLFAVNGGIVNLTATNNVVNAVGGAALDVAGTTGQTMGNPGWTFQSLASTGSPDHGVRIGDLGQNLLVNGTTTVLNADQVGILVQNAGGRTVDFGVASVTDDNVGAGANGNGVDLATNNAGATFTFDSLNVVTDAGFGVLANNSGTLNVAGGGNVVDATGGAALDLTNTALGGGGSFSTLSSAGSPGRGVHLNGVTGTLNATGGAIASATGVAFDVAGGNGNVTYGGTITNTAARSVEVTARNAGAAHAVSFGGLITDSGMGILLDDNDVVTLNFSGGLDLDTTTHDAFVATNGGTLNVTQDNVTILNTVDTTTGVGVRVADTGIGGSGVTFRSVSVNGAPNGIALTNLGGAGTFLVSGDGSTTGGILDRDGSGGSILNTTDDGIFLSNASRVTVRQMNIHDIGNAANPADITAATNDHAVESTGGGDIVLSAVHIRNPVGTGWEARNISGVNRVDHGSLIEELDQTSNFNGLRVTNTDTSFTSFTVADSRFDHKDPTPLNAANNGNSMVVLSTRGAVNGTWTVDGNTFVAARGQAMTLNSGDTPGSTGTVTTVITDNLFENAHGTNGQNNLGIQVQEGTTHLVTITGNTFRDVGRGLSNSGQIIVQKDDTATLDASISGNTIHNVTAQRGIEVLALTTSSGGKVDAEIFDNVIYDVGREGIYVSARGNEPDMDVRIFNNTVGRTAPAGLGGTISAVGGQNDAAGVFVDAQANAVMDVLIDGNEVIADTGSFGACGGSNCGVTTINVENFPSGSAVVNATVENNVFNNNDASGINFLARARDCGLTLNVDLGGNGGGGSGGGDGIANTATGTTTSYEILDDSFGCAPLPTVTVENLANVDNDNLPTGNVNTSGTSAFGGNVTQPDF